MLPVLSGVLPVRLLFLAHGGTATLSAPSLPLPGELSDTSDSVSGPGLYLLTGLPCQCPDFYV